MCKVDNGGKLRFGWKEWVGIFVAMTMAAALPTALFYFHADDGERHQTEREKTELIRSLLAEEREWWKREIKREREMFRTIFNTHEEKVGHDKMMNNYIDHERRITRLEE